MAKAQFLPVGAILAPGQRAAPSALRVMGLSGDRNYSLYHHVLNRAAWSHLQCPGSCRDYSSTTWTRAMGL